MRATKRIRGRQSDAPRHSTRSAVLITSIALAVLGVGLVATGEVSFELSIPIDTVVRAPQGSESLLSSATVPEALVGETCSVTARSRNQSSVHPGNDLVVHSGSRITVVDVEAVPGGTVNANGFMDLNETIEITLVMGPDEVFSAGLDVLFDCPPEPTTTTVHSSSTTVPPATTTTVDVGATTVPPPSSTTTEVLATTTSSAVATTVPPPTTTIVPPTATTSTIPGLPHTGGGDSSLAVLGAAAILVGWMVLLWERNQGLVRLGPVATCRRCGKHAEFRTPHGDLCMAHTRSALDEDDVLWMPTKIAEGSHPELR